MNRAPRAGYGWCSPDAPESSSYLNPVVRRLVRKTGARDVLDAGCGNGVLCGELAEDGFAIVGIDRDPGGIEIARANHPRARFEVMAFDESPLDLRATDDGRFDCVVSTEVVEHLYAPHELARFCYEALRPDGTLIMSTPYHGYLKNLALSIFDKWDDHHTSLWHGGHVKFWSASTLRSLLAGAGLDPVAFMGVGRLPFVWKSMVLVARRPT